MRRFHLIFGLILFIVFLITGRFMRTDFPDKEAIDQELRILMRSRHIYILFSSLIHLVLGIYLSIRPKPLSKAFQYFGSFSLTFSSFLLVWAFISETYGTRHFSDLSRFGIYSALAGVISHLVGSAMPGNQKIQ